MGDWETRKQDAIMDMYAEDLYSKTEEEIKEEGVEELRDTVFNVTCKTVIDNYSLEDYTDKIDEWKSLPIEDKLEYCYKLLQENSSDDFPLLRQVDVFQKLVNLNFDDFDYFDVLECAFFSNETIEDVLSGKDESHTTINIPFHPLIPTKHYNKYIRELRTNSKVSSLNIPFDNAESYLKELLYIWYLHSYNNLNPNQISKKAFIETFSDDKTVIRNNLNKIKNLIVKKPNLIIVNNVAVEAPH